MKSRLGYSSHFMTEVRRLRLSLLEKVLISSLVLMCLISVFSSMSGRDIGNTEQLKMAKVQAQQDLMALRMNNAR
jgi:hypothetical protein